MEQATGKVRLSKARVASIAVEWSLRCFQQSHKQAAGESGRALFGRSLRGGR